MRRADGREEVDVPLPTLDPVNARKPLCYDPARKKLITYDEIVSGREAIVPVDALSEPDLKTLVLARLRAGPDFHVRAMSGPAMSRDDVVRAVERDEPFGRDTLEGERIALRELLARIAGSLPG